MIEKIKKLLSLSDNNPNKDEAVSAALKAQALIAQYDVTKAELAVTNEKPVSVGSMKGQHKNWRKYLAQIVAENFRCCIYMNVSYTQASSGKRQTQTEVKFYGYPQDAQAAKLVFESLYKTGNRLATRAVREADFHGTAGVYNTFAYGFAKGVKEELEKQSRALMLITPPAVKTEFEEMTRTYSKKSCTLRTRSDLSEIQEEGRAAGIDSVRAGRLSGTKNKALKR